MMIAWPDRWYHTSGDTADKSDPTQLKRAAAIGAAGAYTVATADDAEAVKIAGEIASNATRRLGHQLVVGLEALNGPRTTSLADAYVARGLRRGRRPEREGHARLRPPAGRRTRPPWAAYVAKMKGRATPSGRPSWPPSRPTWRRSPRSSASSRSSSQLTDVEKKAAKIVPRPTAKVTADGYSGYRKYHRRRARGREGQVSLRGRSWPTRPSCSCWSTASTASWTSRSLLDAQSQRKSTLQGILNYLDDPEAGRAGRVLMRPRVLAQPGASPFPRAGEGRRPFFAINLN